MTPAEQKALLFLGAVALVGAGVRLFGGGDPVAPSDEERRQLSRQIAATDSADSAQRHRKSAKGRKTAKRRRGDGQPAGADSAPRRPVDVDRATLAELDGLPGVGPSLAKRILADRAAKGPFGSLAALDGVSGVGPALLERLAPHVTFSSPPRPSNAVRPPGKPGGPAAGGRVVGLIGGRP